MAYDDTLIERIRSLLTGHPGVEEKEMFGGLTFTIGGNMACGVRDETLVIRVGARGYQNALAQVHCRECDFTGQPLKGIVMVDKSGFASDGDLRAWVARGVDFASSLPAK